MAGFPERSRSGEFKGKQAYPGPASRLFQGPAPLFLSMSWQLLLCQQLLLAPSLSILPAAHSSPWAPSSPARLGRHPCPSASSARGLSDTVPPGHTRLLGLRSEFTGMELEGVSPADHLSGAQWPWLTADTQEESVSLWTESLAGQHPPTLASSRFQPPPPPPGTWLLPLRQQVGCVCLTACGW